MNTDQQKARDLQAKSTPGVATLPANEDRDTLLHYYYQMVLIRHFEEKSGEMYNKARIGGYCHLNLGEEATVAGFCAALEPQDYVYTNYREHGYALGRGISTPSVMAELFGKETGCSRGRGGSMHLFSVEHRLMGGYGIVGGQLPLATGAAFAVNYRGSNEVVACQMGDGTTNGGPFYESLNLAKIYHLPIIFFVVNNGYGMGLRTEQGSAVPELYRKARAFDMYGERVDGTDVLAVRDAMKRAVTLAREQHEPSLIEAVSYRFRGHSVVDPDRYRDREEVERGRSEQDPVASFAKRLSEVGLLDAQAIAEIDARAQHEVDEAVQFAEESPFPSVEGLYDFVYASDDALKGEK
ncbi:MAG TPA: pyruvate dehydrogenase (acetyl-transferring) E1 component subunit alpha [Ktedonobacteraceae bacterium]|jgi:pyruvate dehydrogenase E1 component alpha subunit|nr:pyruvate dehydrogenase (acetyl-transferring) E1 component subunit alpha [Ktedonobacteraceae bacterium]